MLPTEPSCTVTSSGHPVCQELPDLGFVVAGHVPGLQRGQGANRREGVKLKDQRTAVIRRPKPMQRGPVPKPQKINGPLEDDFSSTNRVVFRFHVGLVRGVSFPDFNH